MFQLRQGTSFFTTVFSVLDDVWKPDKIEQMMGCIFCASYGADALRVLEETARTKIAGPRERRHYPLA